MDTREAEVWARYDALLMRSMLSFFESNHSLLESDRFVDKYELMCKVKELLDKSAIMNRAIPDEEVKMKHLYRELYYEVFEKNDGYFHQLSAWVLNHDRGYFTQEIEERIKQSEEKLFSLFKGHFKHFSLDTDVLPKEHRGVFKRAVNRMKKTFDFHALHRQHRTGRAFALSMLFIIAMQISLNVSAAGARSPFMTKEKFKAQVKQISELTIDLADDCVKEGRYHTRAFIASHAPGVLMSIDDVIAWFDEHDLFDLKMWKGAFQRRYLQARDYLRDGFSDLFGPKYQVSVIDESFTETGIAADQVTGAINAHGLDGDLKNFIESLSAYQKGQLAAHVRHRGVETMTVFNAVSIRHDAGDAFIIIDGFEIDGSVAKRFKATYKVSPVD